MYLAHERKVGNRPVALKISPASGNEPSIQGRLDHPHIVQVFNVVKDHKTGLRGMAMRYMPGASLEQVIQKVKPESHPQSADVLWKVLLEDVSDKTPPPSWPGFPASGTYAEGVAWIIAKLAEALAHAHSRKVLHRDVKPANVLLTLSNGPLLLDFNLSHDPSALDQAEAALRGGTVPYMAPEQIGAFLEPSLWANVGNTADIYSLGLVLCELLTGRRPSMPDDTKTAPHILRNLLKQRINHQPSPRADNPAVPHALEAIAAKCLVPLKAHRYQNASDLAEDLHRFLERRPLRHAVNPSRHERAGNWCWRNRTLLRSSAAASLVLIPALYLTFSPGQPPPPAPAIVVEAPTTSTRIKAKAFLDEGLVLLHQAKDGEDETWSRAASLFQQAVELDGSLYRAWQGLAHVAYHDNSYEQFQAFQSKAIDAARNSHCEKHVLVILIQQRAAATLLIGENIQTRAQPAIR